MNKYEEPVEIYKLAWNKLYNEIANMIDKDVESESNDVLLGVMFIMDTYDPEMH